MARTFSGIPYPHVAFAASRDEEGRGGVVIKAEYPFGVAFQDLPSDPLGYIGSRIRKNWDNLRMGGSPTVSTFHMRMVVSSEAEARRVLSAVQAISESPSVCPVRLRMNSPVSGDQSLTTVSAPDVRQIARVVGGTRSNKECQ